MKKISIIILNLFLLFSLQIYSQSVEKTVDGKTYVIKYNEQIANKGNKMWELIKKENYNCPTRESAKEVYPIEDVVRTILPQKKVDNFIDNKVAFSLTLFCDSLGNVLEVSFHIPGGFNTISLKEISRLEDALKKYRFELINTCPGVKYYIFMRAVHLWKQ